MSNAELRYKDIMKHSHFPSIMMLTYFQFPLKVHLQYDPSATHGYSVDLERNTETEIKEGIKEGVERWLLPALHGGKQYILDNWEKYSFHHLSEMVHTALEQWSISGELPAKQNH